MHDIPEPHPTNKPVRPQVPPPPAAAATSPPPLEAATTAPPPPSPPFEQENMYDDMPELVDHDNEEEEDIFDPNSVIRDIMEDNRDGKYLANFQRYLQKKEPMRGKVVNVLLSSQGSFSWTVRDDITAAESVPDVEYDHVGIRSFDFNNKEVKTGCKKNNLRINFLKLFIHLWPRNWKEQLRRLNLKICVDNKIKKLALEAWEGRGLFVKYWSLSSGSSRVWQSLCVHLGGRVICGIKRNPKVLSTMSTSQSKYQNAGSKKFEGTYLFFACEKLWKNIQINIYQGKE